MKCNIEWAIKDDFTVMLFTEMKDGVLHVLRVVELSNEETEALKAALPSDNKSQRCRIF
jgi:hypothetical protein